MTEKRRGHLAELKREREAHLKQATLNFDVSSKAKEETHHSARIYIEDYLELDDIKRADRKYKSVADAFKHVMDFYRQNHK